MTADTGAQQTAPERTPDWVDTRTGIRDLLPALLHVRIPAEARTFYFGGIALFLFMIQAATGTLLALYYQPTPNAAYNSIVAIMSDINFGWLIRSIHHWAANLMILFVVLHLLRIFYQAAFKFPRELTWIVGVGLLGATMVFGFTGYLLPWDQRAYWATVVGTEIAGSVPIIGDQLLLLLRGGTDVTEATLSRFFGIHVLVMPIALAGLLVIHLTIVHNLGLANPKKPHPRVGKPTGPTKPFFPEYVLDEVIAWYCHPRDPRRPRLDVSGRPRGQGKPARDTCPHEARVVLPRRLRVPQARAADGLGILLPMVGLACSRSGPSWSGVPRC